METDIGQPIDYNPNIHLPKEPPLPDNEPQHHDSSPIDEYMQEQQPSMYMDVPPPQHMYSGYPTQQPFDITSLDKNTYLMAFVAFLLGFFMGKTMISPVIFRNP
jgi:hypothetical protein